MTFTLILSLKDYHFDNNMGEGGGGGNNRLHPVIYVVTHNEKVKKKIIRVGFSKKWSLLKMYLKKKFNTLKK